MRSNFVDQPYSIFVQTHLSRNTWSKGKNGTKVDSSRPVCDKVVNAVLVTDILHSQQMCQWKAVDCLDMHLDN